MILLALAFVPAGVTFACTPVSVSDGDGPVWCAEGPRIRLAGIATREMDGTCRKYQPCSPTDPIVSRDYLARLLGTPTAIRRKHVILVGAPTLRCVSNGSGKFGRTGAWCYSPRVGDVSCAMVRSGKALVWRQFWKDHSCTK